LESKTPHFEDLSDFQIFRLRGAILISCIGGRGIEARSLDPTRPEQKGEIMAKLPRVGVVKSKAPQPDLGGDVEIYAKCLNAPTVATREQIIVSVFQAQGLIINGGASKRLGGVYRRIERAIEEKDARIPALFTKWGLQLP
jgi:hypothetical protein